MNDHNVSGVGQPPPKETAPPLNTPPPPYNPGQSGGGGGDGGFKAFETYFGKENYLKFQEGLCKAIAVQIGHDQKKQKEASDQLKRSIEGDDIYDS